MFAYEEVIEGLTYGKYILIASSGEDFDEVNHSQMRKVIAKRLGESKFSAPHYYLAVEFDMDNAIAFRQQFNSIPDTKISFNDIVVKACALALRQHPQVNSQWFDDRMKLNNHVHIGVAVAVDNAGQRTARHSKPCKLPSPVLTAPVLRQSKSRQVCVADHRYRFEH